MCIRDSSRIALINQTTRQLKTSWFRKQIFPSGLMFLPLFRFLTRNRGARLATFMASPLELFFEIHLLSPYWGWVRKGKMDSRLFCSALFCCSTACLRRWDDWLANTSHFWHYLYKYFQIYAECRWWLLRGGGGFAIFRRLDVVKINDICLFISSTFMLVIEVQSIISEIK